MIKPLGNKIKTIALVINGQAVGLGNLTSKGGDPDTHVPEPFIELNDFLAMQYGQDIPLIIAGEAYDLRVVLELCKVPPTKVAA